MKFATQTAAEKGTYGTGKRPGPILTIPLTTDGSLCSNPSGSYRTTGRRADAGDGGDVSNETEDKSRPLYMQKPIHHPFHAGLFAL